MNVPTFIRQMFTDRLGNLMPGVQLLFDQLFVQLQRNFSDDGLVPPSRTTADINQVADPANENSMPNGTIWYDSEENVLKAKINGSVKVIQTL